MDLSQDVPLTKRQRNRFKTREYVANWAADNGQTFFGKGINPHNQAEIFAAALEKAGVPVSKIRKESANTSTVHHQRIDRNGVITGDDVVTVWAKKKAPYGRLAELRDWIKLLERIGTAGSIEALPDMQCTPYAAAILQKHLDDPHRQVKEAIQERYRRNPAEPFKKAYHLFDIGEDLVLGIKLKDGVLKVEYAFQPGRTAWLKASDLNLRTSLGEVVRQGLTDLQGNPVSMLLDTGDCPHLSVLGKAMITHVHDNQPVISIRLEQDYVSLWPALTQKAA